ncbi:MAG: hypothetical protein IPF99_13195 [Deltaproteobacteria bacterium]|nr:hypothetical protein [Deltaproteobacteria bacterium]
MSTAILRVTNGVRWVTSDELVDEMITATEKEVVEVLGYRAMRLTLKVWSIKANASNPGFALVMDTGMDVNDPAGFVCLGVFDPVTSGPVVVQRVFTDLQRYVRWRIMVFENIDAAQFSIEGVVYE